MEILYLILIFAIVIGIISLIFNIFAATWPFILIAVVCAYIYNRFFKKVEYKSNDEIDNSYFDPYQNYTSSGNNEVIDVEYTEREDED